MFYFFGSCLSTVNKKDVMQFISKNNKENQQDSQCWTPQPGDALAVSLKSAELQ